MRFLHLKFYFSYQFVYLGSHQVAKKAEPRKSSFSRFMVLTLIVAAAGGWLLWKEQPQIENWKNNFLAYIDNRDIMALDVKYTPEQIVKANYPDLVSLNKSNWQEPTLKYYPYLLLDVKYTENQKSREGVLLWGLVNGEMVLNTLTWETTHGFRDCLDCQATRSDFKIMQALARHQNAMSVEELQKQLQVERSTLDLWIENAKYKHLIVQKGPLLQLHFENPKLLVEPQTQIDRQLVSKPSANTQKADRVFNRSQVLAMVKAAFGDDLKVRNEQEVYLPVYNLKIINADQSVYSTDWNAVTGQRIYPYYLANK